MERSISTEAIVVRRERYGEFHKALALLTAELGLIRATAYGAFKMNSRLRLGSEPFTWCVARLYHNPVKHTYKVMELEVTDSFPGLQQEVGRLAAASLWAEIVQKSFGAGETSGGLFTLFLACLRSLCASAVRAHYVTLQFLWRFLALAGYQPDTARCDRCGQPFAPGKAVRYAPRSHSLLCAACAGDQGIPIAAGGLRYLDATRALDLPAALAVTVDEQSLQGLQKGLAAMVQSVLEGELTSLRWAGVAR